MRTRWKSCIWTSPAHGRFVGAMPEADDETRREIIRRLFYLITIAAEDAATLAVEGQSVNLDLGEAGTTASKLRELGEGIEILSSTIKELAV